jgi:hypothetical protein
MLRWLILIGALFGVFVGAVLASLRVGQSQPVPERLRALHLNECAPPCWIGIVPGQTSIDAARQRITAIYPGSVKLASAPILGKLTDQYLLEHHDLVMNSDNAIDTTVTAQIRYVDGVIDSISLIGTPEHFPDFNELIAVLGPPSCIVREFGETGNFRIVVYKDTSGSITLMFSQDYSGMGYWVQPRFNISLFRSVPQPQRCIRWRWNGLSRFDR